VEHPATLRQRPYPLPTDFLDATLLARVERPGIGPCVVAVRGGRAFDITSATAPSASALCELDDPAGYLRSAKGVDLGPIEVIADNSWEGGRDQGLPRLLAPVDLQAVKAAGVTFAVSLLERVIEEQARGDASKAAALRAHIESALAGGLQGLQPGSRAAMDLKRLLIERGLWSQYLEVGIGPDPEVFTKAQPMAAVGFGAHVGIPPFSKWNNPEPEVVLVASSKGRVVGAALGNDVNLRDVEGRSALLLGLAKDNNASAAIGPFVRLFDATFSMCDVRAMTVSLAVRGEDGLALRGESSLSRISRDPEDLVRATIGERHQYPDGVCLYLGTMFAPTEDRFGDGNGFSHRERDLVEIASPRLGTLANEVRATRDCAPWTFGATALMRNLAARGLLS
jgi:fumarylacetoacetate (FAA) hydrolase family protein